MNELQKKYQSTLSSLEHERRLKGRVTAELNTLKNEHGIGGNVGSRQLSYDALLAQNREL